MSELTDAAKVFQTTGLYAELERDQRECFQHMLRDLIVAGLASGDLRVFRIAVAIRRDARFWKKLQDLAEGSATPITELAPVKEPEKMFADLTFPDVVSIGDGSYV